jgi:adiponectin receptor
MPVSRRQQAAMTTPEPAPVSAANENTALLGSQEPTGSRKLLTHAESLRLLPWQTDNDYILNGYRSQLNSVKACTWSAVSCE